MDRAEKDHVAAERNSKPAGIAFGNRDAEDMGYMTSRKFWEMIRRSRRRPTVRLKDVEKNLLKE